MTTSAGSVRTLGRFDAEVGEGPLWLPSTHEIAWVDMPAGLIHRTRLDDETTTTMRVDAFLGAVAPCESGGWVAATGDGFARIDTSGAIVDELEILDGDHRMNDAKCDPVGRFWSGSTDYGFAAGQGGLHLLGPDWSTRQILDGLTLPNGLDWSPAGDIFYLADSVQQVVLAYDCDLTTCELSNQRVLQRFDVAQGMPDGLCVDSDGFVWVALWGGGRVVRLSPDGDVVLEVTVPASQTSSCAFAGPDLDVLAVTSAAAGLTTTRTPDDGALFAVADLGVHGMAVQPFAL